MFNRYGLIGYPLGHSFSKKYFTEKFTNETLDSEYCLFPIESINELCTLVDNDNTLAGLNVTIPYKQKVIEFLDELSDEAFLINAVNTIKIERTGDKPFLKGYNTDASAFESELFDFIGDKVGNALVLGTGGAAAAVAFVLNKHKWSFKFVSRLPKHHNSISYDDIDENLIKNIDLIVNTTPLGMYPNVETAPEIPYQFLTGNHYLFDLVYNPENTQFLIKGMLNGSKCRNGLNMLYKQAELAWDIWNNKKNSYLSQPF